MSNIKKMIYFNDIESELTGYEDALISSNDNQNEALDVVPEEAKITFRASRSPL
jgi:hypothetical protein